LNQLAIMSISICIAIIGAYITFRLSLRLQAFQKMYQKEEILKETTDRLESFSNVTHDAINITTADSKVIYVNPAFEKMFGWSKEELIGYEIPIHF
jgi:PAS domain-containing protein